MAYSPYRIWWSGLDNDAACRRALHCRNGQNGVTFAYRAASDERLCVFHVRLSIVPYGYKTVSLLLNLTLWVCLSLCLPRRLPPPMSTPATWSVNVHSCNVHSCYFSHPTNTMGWLRGSVVERRSLAGELFLSFARPAADGRLLLRINCPLQVSQPGQLSL